MRPRPPVLFTISFGAGLATGLLRFGDTAGVTVLLAAVMGRRHSLAVLLAAAALLGRLAGEVAWWREGDRCAARLPAAEIRLTVRTVEPADSAGGNMLVQPLRAACVDPVTARWPRKRPTDAGRDVVVTGRWVPRPGPAGRPGGTLVVRTVEPAAAAHPGDRQGGAHRLGNRDADRAGTPSLGARLRNAVAEASRTLYGTRAPIVDALVLGRRSGIDRDLQDRFAQSGLVHLLSISGFHVGLIAAWVFLLGRLLRLPRTRALIVAAAVSAAYVAFLGWPAPATRAAALTAALTMCRVRQRNVQADPLLAATCLCVMLVDPWAVLDLGGWLSATALWGATTFTRWTDRTLGTGFWWRSLGSSVGATLATAPITAAWLGTVALIGIVLNFAAIPLAAIAVPGVIASLLAFPVWPALAQALAAGSGFTLHLLELSAVAGAAVPGGHAVQPVEPRSAVPWLAMLALALWGVGARNTLGEALRRWTWAVVAALWAVLAWDLAPRPSADGGGGLALHFLDVGQGDAAVLRTPGGRWVLIDAGPTGEQGDAGRRVVAPFLARAGVQALAMVVVSHAHADHLGGVPSVLDRVKAGIVIEPGALVPDPLYSRFLEQLDAEAIPWHPGRPGERVELDGVRFTVLHPSPAWPGWGDDVNEDSLVLLVEYGDFQALFAGDAGFHAEAALRGRARAVDLLKVGHHGSRWSTGDEWLDSLRARAAVISVGRKNRYGHPAPEALARLTAHRVDVWRTDHEGTVTVTTDGVRMRVRGQGRSATYDLR